MSLSKSLTARHGSVNSNKVIQQGKVINVNDSRCLLQSSSLQDYIWNCALHVHIWDTIPHEYEWDLFPHEHEWDPFPHEYEWDSIPHVYEILTEHHEQDCLAHYCQLTCLCYCKNVMQTFRGKHDSELQFSCYSLVVIAKNCYDMIREIKKRMFRKFMLKHDHITLENKANSVFFFHVLVIYCMIGILELILVNRLFYFTVSYVLVHQHRSKTRQERLLTMCSYIGGTGISRGSMTFTYQQIFPFLLMNSKHSLLDLKKLKYDYLYHLETVVNNHSDDSHVICKYSPDLVCHLPKSVMIRIAAFHDMNVTARTNVNEIRSIIKSHSCELCLVSKLVFKINQKRTPKLNQTTESTPNDHLEQTVLNDKKCQSKITQQDFPPHSPSKELLEDILRGWCNDFQSDNVGEEGCTVCGQLNLSRRMKSFDAATFDKNILIPATSGLKGITRCERVSKDKLIQEIKGVVRAEDCDKICCNCEKILDSGSLPMNALANGLWLGKVPEALQKLSYMEQLLVARVRHNRCIVRVASGMHKMRANAIMFANPTPKVYDILPPPRVEMEEVIAFIFTGPCQPTPEDLKRTPLLVRRNKVAKALEWLKLNHEDYYDLEISYRNLNEYSEDLPPVSITFHETDGSTNKNPESTAVNDNDMEDGVEEGECPMTVHGLNGEELSTMSIKALTARALKHLTDGGRMLAIGHAAEPESMFNNPQLYPKMFPWLFPYGLGGIGNARGVSQMKPDKWKRHLLMYYDKRFQTDRYFPLIAFNHEQIQQATDSAFITTKRSKFTQVTQRLMGINLEVLENLSKRLNKGEYVKPQTDDEKACYELINDLDSVAHRVEGSMSFKKHMRNEVWSTIAYTGAPTWFITFAPADLKHPICLYYADTKTEFTPNLERKNDEKFALIAHNPVAGARFFHMMVQLFLKHILGVDAEHDGLYGKTSAYYGTVEQQGRLTLHLHLMLWIKNSLSPQQIRDKIMSEDSEFKQRIVEYLEGVHMGEFQTGDIDEIRKSYNDKSQDPQHVDPTDTLPTPPPEMCEIKCEDCEQCIPNRDWWDKFPALVDDIVLRSNVHKCNSKCLSNKFNTCKARFPREIVKETKVNQADGSITMKKLEEWINFITPVLTYLLRSNSDVTSLLSGTAIKAIVAYVTDYITKVPLKTHAMFDTIRTVFDKKSSILHGDLDQEHKARKLITSIVNSLTANMEIGGPMASLYLLGHPDHYTNYKFRAFYWRPYVNHIWHQHKRRSEANNGSHDEDDKEEDKIILLKLHSEYVGYSPTLDYIHRPNEYNAVCLYDYIRLFNKVKIYKRKNKNSPDDEIAGYDEDKESLYNESIKETTLELTSENNSREHDVDNDADSEDDELDLIESNNLTDDAVQIDIKPRKVPIGARLKFLPDHPQSKSHSVKLFPESKSFVPNFVSPIPRADVGDREYYCATIMTLFKPWRCADDIKTISDTWDSAFAKHNFTERQQELIANFNIRYECHDAKDDYRLQREKKQKASSIPEWMSDEHINYSNDESHIQAQLEDYVFCPDMLIGEDDELNRVGRSTIARDLQMKEMERILRAAGWMEPSQDGYVNIEFDESDDSNLPQRSTNAWQKLLNSRKQEILVERQTQLPAISQTQQTFSHIPDQVCIVGEEFLSNSIELEHKADVDLIEKIVKDFTLNEEQERAFKIVARHACLPQSKQLLMYLGGMGGTGKSQVIKSLTEFFKQRREIHRFQIMAPTGTSAVVVDGSTYHSVLGIRDIETNINKNKSQVKDKLQGVEYIFEDEVSMVSCKDMYNISQRLGLSQAKSELPFGGFNMIFAGDFAQLPPVQAKPLYDHATGTSVRSGTTLYEQESSIGKALWHQVTTVVMLKQNMRQRTQSDKDAKFRLALENMRYRKCTSDDVDFLRTLVVNSNNILSQKKFAEVPIITAYNSHRDAINAQGVRLFSTRHERELHSFYSIDTVTTPADADNRKNNTKGRKSSVQFLSKAYQEAVWNLPPSSSKHVAGKLDICVGMPVLIKNNVATECGVTNGAPAIVYNWDAEAYGDKQVLTTLFVQLVDPSRSIQIDGLPPNVVPIPRQKVTVSCKLPNDSSITIQRQQVPVLPNFAMTVHASQGRTRKNNVCDITNCANSLAYYTALSRSASADGTIILQGFDERKIQGGITGYLRQEFRELEILNEITKLKYMNKITQKLEGTTRSQLIRDFYKDKPLHYVPDDVPEQLKWTESNPFTLPDVEVNQPRWILDKRSKNLSQKETKNEFHDNEIANEIKESQMLVQNIFKDKSDQDKSVTDSVHKMNILTKDNANSVLQIDNQSKTQSKIGLLLQEKSNNLSDMDSNSRKPSSIVSIKPNSKRKFINVGENEDPINSDIMNVKRRKRSSSTTTSIPTSLVWSANSCAYDSILVIIFNLWKENEKEWKNIFVNGYERLYILSNLFSRIQKRSMTLDNVRWKWRKTLSDINSDTFSMHDMVAINDVMLYTFDNKNEFITRKTVCQVCKKARAFYSVHNTHVATGFEAWNSFLTKVGNGECEKSIQNFYEHYIELPTKRTCKSCSSNAFLKTQASVNSHPSILSFSLPDMSNTEMHDLKISKTITISDKKNKIVVLHLKGIVYYSNSHFTARIIDKRNQVWFYNGFKNNGKCYHENSLQIQDHDLHSCKDIIFETDRKHLHNIDNTLHTRHASQIIYAKSL